MTQNPVESKGQPSQGNIKKATNENYWEAVKILLYFDWFIN